MGGLLRGDPVHTPSSGQFSFLSAAALLSSKLQVQSLQALTCILYQTMQEKAVCKTS